MKRYVKYFSMCILCGLIFILSSCTYINSLMRIASGANSSTKILPKTELKINYYVDDTLYKNETTTDRNTFSFPENPTKDGLNFGGWTYKDSYQTLSVDDIIYKNDTELDLYAYFSKGKHFSDNLSYNGPYLSKYNLPSLGSPKVLVVPVDLGGDKSEQMIKDINTAFNGESDILTGFESVSSYYKKSSNGRLNLSFEVLEDWFKPSKDVSYYQNYDATKDKYYETGSGLIFNEFIAAYDEKIDFSEYDYDKDGYIDSVWMIYNVEPSFSDTTFYWAYVTFSQNTSKKYDGCLPRNYAFASYYFIKERALAEKYHRDLEVYNLDLDIDAHTYIHETGHLLGLNDFYDSDTSKGGTGGLYSAGMMDANQGDLNTIDKLLLGWIDPYVVHTNSETLTYTINPFTESGDVILVSKNNINSIYDEYFLIELYTNTGLNAHDRPIDYPTSAFSIMEQKHNNLYKDYGIRVLHINSNMTYEYDGKTYSMPMMFLYNNSTTRNLFVDTIVNSSKAYETVSNKKIINNYALFMKTGEEINLKNSSAYRMTNNSSIFFNFKIDSLSNTQATVSIIF